MPGIGTIAGGLIGSTQTGQRVLGNVNRGVAKAVNWFENL